MSVPARRAHLARRDQGESAFAAILADLVGRLPGARAAALVDIEGETVDYAARSDPFDVRVAAAHFRIVLQEVQTRLGERCALSVQAARRSFLVVALPQGYALVVCLTCGAYPAQAGRALPMCIRRLAAEAGWPEGPPEVWHPVEIVADDRGRPKGVLSGSSEAALEILGVIAGGLARFERGWRVRRGASEVNLIREATGHWYADGPLASGP